MCPNLKQHAHQCRLRPNCTMTGTVSDAPEATPKHTMTMPNTGQYIPQKTVLLQTSCSKRICTWTEMSIHMISFADVSFQKRNAPLLSQMARYAYSNGYKWHVLDSDPFCELEYMDPFFRKHCSITRVGDRIFVLDSDVVPFRSAVNLDHWATFSEDLLFYDRTWNQEVAAGNYVIRNTNATRTFLMEWADYENLMPTGYSSSDNGAIHLHLIRTVGSEPKDEAAPCASLYHNLTEPVTNLEPYWAFVRCTRRSIPAGSYDEEGLTIRIFAKDTAWMMDDVYDGYDKDGSGPGGMGHVLYSIMVLS
ncbi:hypothetical protein ACHAWF_008470 [Thalassiosira exigua]